MPFQMPPCETCNNPSAASLYLVSNRKPAGDRHLCKAHLSQLQSTRRQSNTGIKTDYAMYDLTCLRFLYDKDSFMFRLDPCETQGRSLYVETDYVALSHLWQILDPNQFVPSIHHLVLHWFKEMSYSIDSVFVDKYTVSERHFRTKIVIKGDKVVHLECRLSDGVALALISGRRLYVARSAEEEYCANLSPEHASF